MPKLVYNLLNDKELKKKCNEVGLNNQGDRKVCRGFGVLFSIFLPWANLLGVC